MRLIIENIKTKAVIGGKDGLLDFDVRQELHEYLRVKADNYRFSPAYREHRWDGFVNMLTPANYFATGFVPMVIKHFKELGVDVVLEDNRKELPTLNEVIDPYIGEIDSRDGKGAVTWVGRDYQVDMVRKVNNHTAGIYFPRGILDCATNAGKTSIAAMIVKNLSRKYKTVFMCSSQEIFKQSVDFFSQVIGEPVGQLKSGKFEPKWFTIVMAKTAYIQAKKSINIKKFLHDTEVLIVDESDEAGAKTYAKVLQDVKAGMRVFVSGTPLDAGRVANMTNIGLSGTKLGTITNKFLIEQGQSQDPLVEILLNDCLTKPCATYDIEDRTVIQGSTRKLQDMVKIIRKHNAEPTLITFTEIAHGEYILEYLQEQLPDIKIALVHGEHTERAENIEAFKQGEVQVLISSSILKRGANLKNIRVFIMAHGGKSVRDLKQFIGRALRHDGIHDTVHCYDWYDIGTWVGKHSQARIKTYRAEGFKVSLSYKAKKNGSPIY